MKFFFIFMLALIPVIVSAIIIPIYKKHYKTTDTVVNYDSLMRKFVYKLNLSRDEIISRLLVKNINDELTCSFNFENKTVTFSEENHSYRRYYFFIIECDGYTLLRLEEIDIIGMSSHVSLKLNPFMVEKLQAQIIPYFE